MQNQWLRRSASRIRIAIIVMMLFVAGYGSGHAQDGSVFARLAGEWNGSGTIELANGSREPLRCKAAYDVLGGQSNLQLNIRCASDSDAGASKTRMAAAAPPARLRIAADDTGYTGTACAADEARRLRRRVLLRNAAGSRGSRE